MSEFIYRLGVILYRFALVLSERFSDKASKMIKGRRNIWTEISAGMQNVKGPVVWVHCASLGEFEQGRPFIEKIKGNYDNVNIVVTFFSASGYEVRKNYPKADAVFYLPFDTHRNAEKFISAINPVFACFVKYEFWHFYLKALERRNIPMISISSIFRPGQIFFKSYGKFYRNILSRFDHFFVQNQTSKDLLLSIGLSNAEVSGDTRFDRVHQICSNPREIPIAARFKGDQPVFVIGSSWPDDIDVLHPFINQWAGRIKFIIAPHEPVAKNLDHIDKLVKGKTIRYSQAEEEVVGEYDVLVIDNVGMLSSLYSHAEYAYIGGAFNNGLHNTLEAAAYGMPMFFGRGKKNMKFREAVDMVLLKAAFEISSWQEIDHLVMLLYNDPEKWKHSAIEAKKYVDDNLGATDRIMSYADKFLNSYE